MILADRQRRRVAQREPVALPQKAAVLIGSRKLLQTRFTQPLEPLGNLLQLLLQPRDHLAVHFAARTFVRIVRIALLLPTPNFPPNMCPRIPQRLFRVDAFAAMRSPRCASSRWPRVPNAPVHWPAPTPPLA